ncbi:unnamed protein product [Urochloa humidicola]
MEPATAKRACASSGSAPDRLSALSDDLLCHVLSFLPSRQAVQTAVLSERWMDLWHSVPAISFGYRDFEGGIFAGGHWCSKMQDLANNLLMLNNARCFDAFRLDLSYIAGHTDLRRDCEIWIRRGIKCQPIVLAISLDLNIFRYHFQIPRLGSEFRRLKSLEFWGVSLESCFSERLSSGCPILEDLVLGYCRNEFLFIQFDTLVGVLPAIPPRGIPRW